MKKFFKKSFFVFVVLTIVAGAFGPVNTFAVCEIVGDGSVYLPPSGKFMQVEYLASGISGDAVWSLKNEVSGVEMMEDGCLIVSGDATPGAVVEIQAETEAGELVAEKEVTIVAKPETYADINATRHFEDFEVYANDTNIAMKGSPSRPSIKYAAQAGTTLPVGKETNGNTYAKASGAYYWGNLATFELYSSWNAVKPYMNGSRITTFEGRFMVENATAAEQALMFFDNAGLKLMYKASSNPAKADVYDFATSSSVSIATVNVDEWFDLRAEFDHVNSTYDIYLNNERIITANTLNNNLYVGAGGRGNGFFIGASVDDIAMYNGKLLVPEFSEMPEVVYLTAGRDEAVVELDSSLMLGEHEMKDAVSYSGITNSDGKLFLQKDSAASGTATSTKYNAQKDFSITTADGLEYDFSDAVNVPVHTGTVDGGKLDLTSGNAEFDLSDVKGRALVTFDLYNESDTTALDIMTDAATKSITFPSAGADGKTATIVVDTFEDSYIVLLGDKIVSEGVLNCESVDSLEILGGKLDNFVFTSMTKTKPFAINPAIDGIVAVGQTVDAGYRYFSPWNKAKASETVEWLVADSEFGQYQKVADGSSYTPDDDVVGKWLKFTVKASDSEFESGVTESASVQIADVFSVEFSGDNIKVTVMDSLNTEHVFVITRYYSLNSLVKTKMNKVVFGGGSSVVLENPKEGCDGAAVALLYPDSLKPVGSEKTVGTVPTETAVTALTEAVSGISAEVENGKLVAKSNADVLASVVVYGHENADIFKEYGDVFEKAEVFAKAEDSQSIVYATNVLLQTNKKTEITLPLLARGAYHAEIIPRSGATAEVLWMEKPEAVMKKSEMSNDGFLSVMKLFSDKTDAEVQWIFDEYKKLDDTKKNVVDKVVCGEGYDIGKLDATVCLMAHLNNPKTSGDVYSKMSAEFLANGYDKEKVSIICNDADPAATVNAVFASTFTDTEALIDVVYEKSILYGIYHVKNYKEADNFLKELTDQTYAQSSYKDELCNLVAGTLYNSIPELVTALKGYTPPGGGNGGGSGGGGGGGGGGGAIPPKSEAPELPIVVPEVSPAVKKSYSDVDEKHWANEAITYLKERNIVNGMPDGRFVPDGNVTRAEFVKIICEAFVLETDIPAKFADVKNNDWYEIYVGIAGGLNIINGSDGMFLPNRAITREDAAVIVYRVIESAGLEVEAEGKTFADAENISDYAKQGIGILHATGLVNGMEDGRFCPKNNMTRAECAKMISDILRRYGI